jgi:tRNA(Ile)-lysidine synthetase-like protein
VRALVEGLATVEDPTNADPAQRRRRVRTEVLPALARLSGGSGDPVALLTRLADLARDDADLLERLAAAESARMVRAWGPVRVIPAAALRDLPPALGRRVVRALLAEVRGGLAGLDAAAVDRVLALAPGGEVTVAGGARVTANGGWLAAAPGDLADLPVRALGVPGRVALPELGLELRSGDQAPAEGVLPPRARQPRGPAALGSALLGPEARDGLIVRARQPGDRVGHRSLGDRFTDLGVPRALRGLVPVVALAARPEEPLWVPGVALSPPGMGRVVVRLTEGH